MVKKGFTLIELLAVILILGVIALIAIPVVNNIINESKRGSFKITIQNIVKAAETKCQTQKIKGEILTGTYTFSNTGVSPSLEMKGKLPIGGTITVDDECNVTISDVTDGKYTATKESASEKLTIVKLDEEISPSKVCSVTVGDGTHIGDVITCGTESFYVYDTTGDSIKMLAKYNLKVGKIYTSSSASTEINSNEEGYGLQNEEMISSIEYPRKGTIDFSSFSKHGINYSTYEGSIVEEYVNNYRETLTNMGVAVQDARLITKEELVALGCNEDEYWCSPEQEGTAPEWVYSTSYWSGSAVSEAYVWYVSNEGVFGQCYFFYDNSFIIKHLGLRPVVIISKSEI